MLKFFSVLMVLVSFCAPALNPSHHCGCTLQTALFVGTSIGDVFDYTTKAKIGVFQAFTVSTGTEASMPGGPITVGTMSNLVIELGPSGDDSITTSGTKWESNVTIHLALLHLFQKDHN